jgi:hypothetical protein
MKIKSLPVIIHFDTPLTIEIMEDFSYINSEGTRWDFKKGWKSDGHSTGKYFKHFDEYTIAALSHDQDCERSWEMTSYAIRREGDKNYKFNLKELGASKSTVYRRYAAVSARTRWLKFTGELS